MRKQPDPPPTVTSIQSADVVIQEREYKLITPLFGGGVAPGEIDPVTIIRGTEVRAQLRFWWRACCGGRFDGDLDKMKKAEDKLWGSAYKKGEEPISQKDTIQIIIEVLKSGASVIPYRIEKNSRGENQAKPDFNSGIPPYVAFPLQPNQDELKKKDPPLKSVQVNVSFKMTISFPTDHQKEIEASLWAWETFGGIGARTRRGFGALRLLAIDGKKNPEVDKAKVQRWIQDKLLEFVEPGQHPEGVPHISQNLEFRVITMTQNTTPLVIWQNLIRRLEYFRQTRTKGRTGRSIWPEAEAIRKITGRRDDRYKELPHPQKFPRAVFGLPIIFHFKDPKDPQDTTLQENSEKKDRFASPLILRPFLCRDNQAIGLALLLEGSRVDATNLVLVKQDKTTNAVESILTQNEANNIAVLNGETDILQAFMNSLKGAK